MTANAIADAQRNKYADVGDISVVQLEDLREQDFGSFECLPWSSKRSELARDKIPKPGDAGFRPKETSEAMALRADAFLNDYIMPQLVVDEEQEGTIAVVSHGLMLAVLWKSLLGRFGPATAAFTSEVFAQTDSRRLDYLPAWSNTGYLEIDLIHTPSSDGPPGPSAEHFLPPENNQGPARQSSWKMVVRNMDGKAHLSNLKRTRGGVGSSTHDERQKNLEDYFKRSKVALGD